ncbi:TsoY family (seleno)protein [Rhodalgimonas zhirmunskyi]|uniref:Voltage-dependent anion channel n=1 Tax=Rhodalgimonas zhirmunskyi TaxID=2964767 RepID=A0AAJ1X6T7_9RHOB|nr:hypothetical protein [Rhodoalgimonas zhirmunskyi]MDQ2095826.1 hypothetical protein [Rhodoalgimonas zhirmunskyi]
MSVLKRPADTYSPLYFLASLGAGGLSVTFFMIFFFWVDHPGRSVPIFEDIIAAWAKGFLPQQIAIVAAWIGIAVFAFLNVKYLIWNLRALAEFKKTDAYTSLRNSNAETTLLAGPLAMAMSINAMFVVGMAFVPGLWSVVEYLFPFAMIAFGLTGLWALKIIGDFLGRVLAKGGLFDVTAHNSFAQLLPAFALAMVGVGFAAPAAMSTTPATVTTAMMISTFFAVASLIYTLLAATTAFTSMLHYGTHKEAGPTLMVIVPIVTILSILFMRQGHGLHVTFNVHTDNGEMMMFLARMIAVQIIFLSLGLLVMRRQGYFTDFVLGQKTSAGSYALVCPGVAFTVLMHFFINKGLVAAGAIDKFGVAFWVLSAIAVASQILMIALVFRLNRQHFGKPTAAAAVPAE